MSTGELGAVGVDVEGLDVPGLESLLRNDDGSVAGDALSRLVAAIDPSDIVDEVASLDFITLTDRVVGWAQAMHLRAIADFVRRPELTPLDKTPFVAAPLGDLVREFADSEVAAALGLTARGAESRIGAAMSCASMPATWAALMSGRIDYPRMLTMFDETAFCEPDAVSAIEAAVLAKGRRGSPGEFRRSLRRAVLRHDREGAKKRSEKARADVYVRTGPASPDTAWLDGHLRAEDAAAIKTVLDAAAASMRREPDESRGVDQLRVAALVAPFWAALATGLLTTPQGPLPLAHLGGQAPALELIVDHHETADASRPGPDPEWGAAVHEDREPATLAGYGPVTAEVARQIASCAVTGSRPRVRLIDRIDADTALRLAHAWVPERDYRPSPALARHLRARNCRCVFPGCGMPARRCDLDHTVPWPDGETHPSNLAPLCRRHHRLKHHAGVRLEQPRPGRFRWTMPTGHTYATGPPPDG